MGKVLLEEEVGYKEYSLELVQTCSDQSLGRKTVAAEQWTMGWESHLHRIHLCAALTGSSLRTSRPVQLVRDKLFHGPMDDAGVGGIHQSLNVDNPVYKQLVDYTRHVCGAGVSQPRLQHVVSAEFKQETAGPKA